MIALHLKAHTTQGTSTCGSWAPKDLSCINFETRGWLQRSYDLYLVAVDPVPEGTEARGIAGVQWGIYYNDTPHEGVDIFSWSACGDLEIRLDNWPAAGSGNIVTWAPQDNCQRSQPGDPGVHAVVGSFYIYAYSEDAFSVVPVEYGDPIPHPTLQIADCDMAGYDLDVSTGRGAVQFSENGTKAGYNPCTGEGELPPLPEPPPPPPPPPPPSPPSGDQEASVLLHVTPVQARGGSCDGAPTETDSIVTSAALVEPVEYTIFLLATPKIPDDPGGLSAIQLGIAYPSGIESGIRMLDWHSCVNTQLPVNDWPQSNSGNILVWADCQHVEMSVAGYFRVAVYDPSAFAVVPHPQKDNVLFTNCALAVRTVPLSQLGWISFGGARLGSDPDGCNPLLQPCARGAMLTHVTTWGKLKTKY